MTTAPRSDSARADWESLEAVLGDLPGLPALAPSLREIAGRVNPAAVAAVGRELAAERPAVELTRVEGYVDYEDPGWAQVILVPARIPQTGSAAWQAYTQRLSDVVQRAMDGHPELADDIALGVFFEILQR